MSVIVKVRLDPLPMIPPGGGASPVLSTDFESGVLDTVNYLSSRYFSVTVGEYSIGLAAGAGDGSPSTTGVGGDGVFTGTGVNWVVDAWIGAKVLLCNSHNGSGVWDAIGEFTVTDNDATHLYFTGDATGADRRVGQMPTISNNQARSGSKSMKFVFNPYSTGYSESFFKGPALPNLLHEVWVEYYIYIPSNYTHCESLVQGQANNNKFFDLYGTTYQTSRTSPTVLVGQTWRDTTYEDGRSSINVEYFDSRGIGADGYNLRDGPVTHNFIGTPAMGSFLLSGQWNGVRVHYRESTAALANDGVYEMFTNKGPRWETAMQFHADFYSKYPDYQGIGHGMLLGATNSGYVAQTIFNIDDFKLWVDDPGWPGQE